MELNPKNTHTYVNRGGAYVKLGNHKHAIADYDKAIELNAEFALAYYNRGLAYSAIWQLQSDYCGLENSS